MKRIIFILSLLFYSLYSFAQTPEPFVNPRSSSSITVQDYNLSAIQNLYLPRLRDTVSSNSIDSIGNLIYDRLRAKLWIRDTVLTGGHKWTQILKTGDVAWGTITGILSNQTDLQNVLNLKFNTSDTTNKWVQNLYSRNDSLFKFKNGSETFVHIFSTGINNTNIGSGFRPVNELTQQMRTYFGSFGVKLDTVTNANGMTWRADTTRVTGLPTYFYVDSSVNANKITANNGLTKTGNNIQLGGLLTKSDTLDGSTLYSLQLLGSGTAAPLRINHSGSGNGAFINTFPGTGIALNAQSNNANTIQTIAFGTGYGASLQSIGNIGAYIATTSGVSGAAVEVNPSSTNTSQTVLQLKRYTSGTAANGIAGRIEFITEPSSGTVDVTSGYIENGWENATFGSRSSYMSFFTTNSTTTARKLNIASTGQLTLDQYTGTNFQTIDTSFNSLVVDGSGNIFKRAGDGGGGGGGAPALTYKNVGYGGVGNTLSPGESAFQYDSIINRLTVDTIVLHKMRSDSVKINITKNTATKNAYFFGTSIPLGFYTQDASGNLDSSRRYPTYVCRSLGWTELNYGIAGMTLQNRSPVTTNMITNRMSLIPVYSASRDTAIFFDFSINDQTKTGQGLTNYNTTNFITDYTTVIDTVIARGWPLGLIHIIASNYVDTSLNLFNPYSIQLDYYNATKTVASNFGVQLIDVFQNSFVNRKSFFYIDGLHPSNTGHSTYAIKVLQSLGASVVENNQNLAANGVIELQKLAIKKTDTTNINYQVVGIDQYNNAIKIPNGFFIENNPIVPQYGGINLVGDIYATRVIANGLVRATANRVATNLVGSGPEIYWDGSTSYLSSLQETPSVAWKPLDINQGGSFIGLGTAHNAIDRVLTTTLAATGYLRAKGLYPTSFTGGDEVFMGTGSGVGYFASFDGTGLTGRPLSLNNWGKQVMINTDVVTGTAALFVNGKIAVNTHTIASNADSALVWNRSTNEYQIAKINGAAATTLYNGDGILSGNRTVTGSNNNLTFATIGNYRINATSFVLDQNATGFPYSGTVIATGGHNYELGYTPTPTVYSKGAGLYIDTNNNVGLGVSVPTTAPLYSNGGTPFLNGLQNQGAYFNRVDSITTSVTLNTSEYFIRVDASGGAITLTLPAASSVFGSSIGIVYKIQKIDASGNAVTISRSGANTINGATSQTISTQYDVHEVQCTSTTTWAYK